VQAQVVVPVETALGLSSEPGWLQGYGWVSAPSCRLLLVDAELRRVCAQTGSGQLLDVADRLVRPVSSPVGVRAGLLDMVMSDASLSGVGDRVESEHDPSRRLREFVVLRDRGDDGPTGTRARAASCHLDHDEPFPQGPTAAWNLVVRAGRTHQLKHYGWVPLRTPTMTVWTSPAGQLVQVPNQVVAPPGIDRDMRDDSRDSGDDCDGHADRDMRDEERDGDNDRDGRHDGHDGGDGGDGRDGRDGRELQAFLPDPDELDLLDRAQLEPPSEDGPPWLPASERDHTTWTWPTDNDIAC
jgi:hypothetical protein